LIISVIFDCLVININREEVEQVISSLNSELQLGLEGKKKEILLNYKKALAKLM